MRLLFITQKLHGQDAFGILWVRAFIAQGYEVEVVCLEGAAGGQEGRRAEGEKRQEVQKGAENGTCTVESSNVDMYLGFPVHSLGKEHGASRLQSALRFEKLILSLRYDRVFIHMAPVWYVLGGWWWLLARKAVYLWYTHYTMQLGVRLFGCFGKRFFCATSQSLPQYPSTNSGQVRAKKVVVGHGIDLAIWPERVTLANDPHRLLVVHRLSRSKRLELILRALAILDIAYTLDVYGIEAEPDYVVELKHLVKELHLESRVKFLGTTPMQSLPEIYARHTLILNMASETIDKTMLEAMTCGCYPVTTSSNAAAIGIPFTPSPSPEGRGEIFAPESDTPSAIAEFIRQFAVRAPIIGADMYRIVERNHSLARLISKMDSYIRQGI